MTKASKPVAILAVLLTIAVLVLTNAPHSYAANNDQAPARTIAGSLTQLEAPLGIGFDSNDNLYVADTFNNSVLMFSAAALSASGSLNIAPDQVIVGAATQLNHPAAIAFDADGNLYVGQQAGLPIVAFRASDLSSSGTLNLTPLRTITFPGTGKGSSGGLAFDRSGNLYSLGNSQDVVTFAESQLRPTGNLSLTPTRTIIGSNTQFDNTSGLSLDRVGNLYVSNYSGASIVVFSAAQLTATGTVNLSPIRTIAGGLTGLDGPWQLRVGPDGNLYSPNQNDAVKTFAVAGLTGTGVQNIAASSNLAGPATNLNIPTATAFDSSGNMYVTNFGKTISAYTGIAVSKPAFASNSSIAVPLKSPMVPFTVVTTGFPVASITNSAGLPPGVNMTSNGDGTATVRGTPTKAGSFTTTLTARSAKGTATQRFTVTVRRMSQTDRNGCALAPRQLRPAGLTLISKANCRTNLGLPIHVQTIQRRLPRGDLRSFSIECVAVDHLPTRPHRSPFGYWCGQRATAIRTYGNPLAVSLRWHSLGTPLALPFVKNAHYALRTTR